MGTEQVTLFIIEDDDVDYQTIKRSLNKKKIANPIVRACDGQEAIELLQQGKLTKPFVILLDIQMPRMNGLEFLTHIRKDKIYGDSVIFMLTTSKDENDIVASYSQHVAGYFVKDQAGNGFLEIADLLDGYWRIVHLPK